MSEGLQDIGAVVTAGIAARELEKKGRGAGAHNPVDASGHDAGHACANCGTPLIGEFCHACGQVGHVHKTAGAFFHDIAHGVFHFEGKIWRTLPMLVFRPGRLTRRYIDGERVRFVSPMALFLFSVFIMFASLGLITKSLDMGDMTRGTSNLRGNLTKARSETEDKIRSLEVRRARAVRDGDTPDVAEFDARLKKQREDLKGIVAAQGVLGKTEVGSKDNGFDVNTGFPGLNQAVNHSLENPQLALYKVKTAAYKYSWALIPISLPFIWLLFPFSRRFGFYDHAVFSTYSLSFMTMLVTTASLLSFAGVGLEWLGLMWLIPPVHFYAQLKGAYLLGRWGALIRTVVLIVFTLFTTTFFGLLLAYLGLA